MWTQARIRREAGGDILNKDKRDEAREATVQNWITNRVETTGGVPSDYSSAEVEAVRFGFDG